MALNIEEHPHDLIVDCVTGRQTYVPFTEAEARAKRAQDELDLAAYAAQQTAVDEHLAVVRARAADDPAFASLARLAGIPVTNP